MSAEPWIDPRTMVWIGSIGGCVIGLWGAAIGTAGSYLVPKGKGKGLVISSLVLAGFVGVLILSFGVTALAFGQPYSVWYPGVQLGGLLSALAIPFVFVMRNRYRAVELRKMQAEELS